MGKKTPETIIMIMAAIQKSLPNTGLVVIFKIRNF